MIVCSHSSTLDHEALVRLHAALESAGHGGMNGSLMQSFRDFRVANERQLLLKLTAALVECTSPGVNEAAPPGPRPEDSHT